MGKASESDGLRINDGQIIEVKDIFAALLREVDIVEKAFEADGSTINPIVVANAVREINTLYHTLSIGKKLDSEQKKQLDEKMSDLGNGCSGLRSDKDMDGNAETLATLAKIAKACTELRGLIQSMVKDAVSEIDKLYRLYHHYSLGHKLRNQEQTDERMMQLWNWCRCVHPERGQTLTEIATALKDLLLESGNLQ